MLDSSFFFHSNFCLLWLNILLRYVRGVIETLNLELAPYHSNNKCTKTDNVFFRSPNFNKAVASIANGIGFFLSQVFLPYTPYSSFSPYPMTWPPGWGRAPPGARRWPGRPRLATWGGRGWAVGGWQYSQNLSSNFYHLFLCFFCNADC